MLEARGPVVHHRGDTYIDCASVGCSRLSSRFPGAGGMKVKYLRRMMSSVEDLPTPDVPNDFAACVVIGFVFSWIGVCKFA